MMEARDSSHQLEYMQALYEHIRAGAGAFPLHQPSPYQQQQQQHQHPSPHQHQQQQQQHNHHHHHYQQQQQQQQQQIPHHHLHHLHHFHHQQQHQQQEQEQHLHENASRNSFNAPLIHPAPLRQISPNPNFNPGPGPNLNPSTNPGSNLNPNSSSGISACYPPETPPHMVPHQVQTASPPSGIGASTSPGSAMVPRPAPVFKKKRGRPRKYCTDINGSAALVMPLNPVSTAEQKGGARGPSKKTQSLTSGTTGQGFTPHVLTVGAGEDVTAKIMTFSQHGPWAVCILSANGAISNASLWHAGISSSSVTYEGRFEILSLSGLFLLTDDGATRTRSGGFSVSLAGQDGRVIGGKVAGLLIAATPIQVVVGTFFPESRKHQPKTGNPEGSTSLPPSGGKRQSSMQMFDKEHNDAIETVQDYVPEPPEGLLKEEQCASNAMPLQSVDWGASDLMRRHSEQS